MKIALALEKNTQENANTYFERAKKAKKKIQGAKDAILRAQMDHAKANEHAQHEQEQAKLLTRPQKWYHKYRWCITQEGNLIVGGQNASANETLIKHHTDPTDTVFHTDMAGSPFFILKTKQPTKQELSEAAQLTAAYSRAWKQQIAGIEVFYVKPEQVTKEAQSGEYLPKGAFMIRGETTYVQAKVELYIGLHKEEGYIPEIRVGTKETVEHWCERALRILPGKKKTSEIGKQLIKTLRGGTVDSYNKVIPAGGSTIE